MLEDGLTSCHILPEPRLLCGPRRPSAPVHMRPVPNNVVPGPASFQGKASRKVQVIRDSHLYNAEVLGPFQYRFLPRTRHRSYNPACSTCLQVDLSIVPTVPPQYFATNAQSATAKGTITLPWLEGSPHYEYKLQSSRKAVSTQNPSPGHGLPCWAVGLQQRPAVMKKPGTRNIRS